MTCPPPQTLADLRRAAGVSRSDVAARMGVGERRVGHIESVYPNLRYDTLSSYIAAIGGRIQFTVVGGHPAYADQMVPDPGSSRTRDYLSQRNKMGNLVYVPSSPEELPLQGDQPEPGGDDPSREVDEPDPQSDQADGGHGQQS